jgi:hypothetical protein
MDVPEQAGGGDFNHPLTFCACFRRLSAEEQKSLIALGGKGKVDRPERVVFMGTN